MGPIFSLSTRVSRAAAELTCQDCSLLASKRSSTLTVLSSLQMALASRNQATGAAVGTAKSTSRKDGGTGVPRRVLPATVSCASGAGHALR